MSHELRTPLNHIIGFTEIILDGHFGKLNHDQREYLLDVLQSSNHLLTLINDILDLSKVEAGKLELELSEVSLQQLLDNSLTMVKERSIKDGIRLKTAIDGIPESVVMDERKVKQVIYNLLSNAVKFTPKGGEIILNARTISGAAHTDIRLDDSKEMKHFEKPAEIEKNDGEDVSDYIEISISDTGIGIESKDQTRIFNEFEQIDSSASRLYQGTGLGLSLAKKFVELHGGKIWVESEGLNQGSTFRFIIPGYPIR
jgi:signal transduction histidine kinase